MPYVQKPIRRELAPNHESLVATLVSEFKPKTLAQDALTMPSDAPIIIEEQMRNSDRLQVYVKWSGWKGVREDHRTSAIMDAYEQVLGRDYAKRIVIALGVTPAEAEELDIRE